MDEPVSFLRQSFQKAPIWSVMICSFLFTATCIGIFFLSTKVSFSSMSTGVGNSPTRLSQTEYPLINPLLLCNVERVNDSIDVSLKQKINDFITTRITKGQADKISVYLQEYKIGKWVGVNENEQYDPASLLKVPLMIAYLQISEKTPSILNEQTSYTGDDQNADEYFKSQNNIKPGVSYSINDLISSMIVNSDNTAMTLLSNYVDKNSLFTVYTDLGLPTPPNDPTVQYISAKSYAYFFRILYNATYLSRADSQKALTLLSKGHLPNGIASAVPDGIVVADKFGERSVYDQNHTVISRELHDCGIVYKNDSPYLLCIMSKGNDFKQLAQNIHDLSALVYADLTK